MGKAPILIYPPTVDWDHLHQRPQQLIKALSRNGAIGVFCNTNVERRHVLGIEALTPTLFLANNMAFTGAIKWARNQFPGHPVVVLFSYPDQVTMVTQAGADMVIFDSLDEPENEFAHWKPKYEESVMRANLTVASATSLCERAQRYRDDVVLIQNACDYDHFKTAQEPQPLNEAPFNQGKKIAGFIGAVATWLDWELIRDTASQLPSIEFVFIGPFYGFRSAPITGRNIHFLGVRDYAELPKYLSNFDVALVPFQVNAMTRGVSPIKMWEYLASGVPVISTPIPEAVNTHGVIIGDRFTYKDLVQEWVNEAQDGREQRIQTAQQNSWDDRARTLVASITRKLKEDTRMAEQKPSVGRIVHYVMTDADEHVPDGNGGFTKVPAERPAVIVRVWHRLDDEMPLVQLQVFTDGTNDGTQYSSGVTWRTSVHYDEAKAPGSWHWPERE